MIRLMLAQIRVLIECLVHLLRMASYKVNAGNREEEVCSLKWAWERKVPDIETSVFVIPGDRVKNAVDRLVVLNRVARSAVEAARGMHPEYVFVRQEKDGRSIPIKKMYGTAWKNARERAADAWERAHHSRPQVRQDSPGTTTCIDHPGTDALRATPRSVFRHKPRTALSGERSRRIPREFERTAHFLPPLAPDRLERPHGPARTALARFSPPICSQDFDAMVSIWAG
jgi:hypothetical protein